MTVIFFKGAKAQQPITNIKVNTTAVRVNVRQQLNLGAFTQGASGGSIQVLADGTRTAAGTVVPLNFGSGYMPLILEIEGPRGAIVSMLTDDKTELTGSNGGSMKLRLTGANPSMPFIITNDAPAKSVIKIGAELIVGNSTESPPGNYSGSLNISFVVE
ncbi:MAG: DUF4402 domain-containing protein [Sphingobacteriales bacterium]|nr:MAG: DUF4402 domain-containing protein [Sphingobacteriales bacterium]